MLHCGPFQSNSASLDDVVIEPSDPRYQFTIGQGIELSFLDAKTANLEYCSGKEAMHIVSDLSLA